ncbi:hypothetical protein N7462_005177 [Penicillium macrosclerotiorum]|uniref:uncharacterized protein n=1 Tax=Penicillium macrosclerotiorum TaxID=303699 RepID=UPI002546ACB1|nr:uncharacterized protein N7462_005177 [Penicillium macrosclerotiorum]KAJ5690785.1 hypothetical protein N7462_005177 [Penicillium macrosclerotiorum]
MATTLQTSTLGQIRGKSGDGVTQYLGIKYANLKNRFADAELIESRGSGTLDGTRDGPTALSHPIGCERELGHVQHSLPEKELYQSDLDCLNLNIAVPSDTTPSSKLPVLFFIHGGGLFVGANSWPQYDLTRLVKLSKDRSLPTVVVAINYRLGAAGFLTSEELRNAGYKANNGLRDQRVALEWVRKNIVDFGGDPDNITVGGMSAGAASVTYHLQSSKPLFKRAIAMSGTSLLTKALPYELHEENYKRAVAALDLTDATAEERVKALLEMPGQKLIAKLPPSVFQAPALDNDIVYPGVTYTKLAEMDSNTLPGKSWCQDLLVGNAEVDVRLPTLPKPLTNRRVPQASIFEYMAPKMKNNCARRFVSAINEALASYPQIAERILQAYDITEDSPDENAIMAVLTYFTDIVFHAPALTYAQGWRGNAYVYYFNEGNPWDGPWKNRANHILDVTYFFQNFREFLTTEQQAVCTVFAEDFFKFCHGIAPWPAITPGKIKTGFSARIYGPSRSGITANVSSQAFGGETLRRSVLFDCASVVPLDELARVFVIFQTT